MIEAEPLTAVLLFNVECKRVGSVCDVRVDLFVSFEALELTPEDKPDDIRKNGEVMSLLQIRPEEALREVFPSDDLERKESSLDRVRDVVDPASIGKELSNVGGELPLLVGLCEEA